VLMGDHYHLVLRTPEANLVGGMKWFQNSWTKRFNTRHQLSGPVFGDRYKSVLVEEGEHLGTLIDYVHLNPFRAKLATLKRGLESYRWSSLPDYTLPPRERSGWVEVARGLAQKGFPNDSAAARRRYLEHLEGVARERGGVPESPDGEERTLQSTLRRGWYFGSEGFREKMLQLLEDAKGREGKASRRRGGFAGPRARDHGEAEAKRLLKRGLAAAGLRPGQLPGLRKCDWRKRAIAHVIRKRTVVPVAWIVEALAMGHPNGAAGLIRNEPSANWGPDWRRAAKLVKRME